MSETSESQQPSEQPPVDAPRPGVRIRPPGAAPGHRVEDVAEPTSNPTPPADPLGPETAREPDPPEGKRRAKKAPPRRRRAAGGSSSGPARPSPGPETTETRSPPGSTDADPFPGPDERPPAFADPEE